MPRQRARRARVVVPGPLRLLPQQRLHCGRSHAASGVSGLLPQIVFAAAVGAQILLRNIDATLLEITPHVAQDVGELQGDAEIDRVLLRRRLAAAEDVEADEPDGRRDANAVPVQFVERLVAARPEIHLDAFDERLEWRARQAESRHERGKRASLPRLGRPPSKQAASSRRQRAISAAADARPPGSRSLATSTSSTASSTARQKSHTAMIACRLAGGSTRNE